MPDFIPVAGYGDDLAALLYAIGQVASHINSDKDIIEVDAQIVEVEKNIELAAADDNTKEK